MLEVTGKFTCLLCKLTDILSWVVNELLDIQFFFNKDKLLMCNGFCAVFGLTAGVITYLKSIGVS